ncbi:MAG: methionine--tRNA ligase [Candidatus Roizmanbacteria bacterium]|nr:methionine--tRNA ligase [Candidatus Roizmanbacteria bacterium]
MNKTRILVADAWPYVNGKLHIGHLAGHVLPADIFARFNRFIGNEVLFVSGSDCYGTPITVEADKRGTTPQAIVDEYHPAIVELYQTYGISYDLYTKTATLNHTKVVQDMFVALCEHGYISIGSSQQYYDGSQKRFLPDRYVEGVCVHCGFVGARSDQCDNCGRVLSPGELKNPVSKLTNKPVELRETEHYFLDLPKLSPMLEAFVEKREKNWRPWVREETRGWLKRGLEPRAITRDLEWGIPIPVERLPQELRIEGVDRKRIYVWFDAVIGYLSASIEWGEKNDAWKPFWYPNDDIPTKHYYFMGKDNLVFHTLFWPAQLYGYDEHIHLPDEYPINQYLNLGGHKFSKSRGVIVDSRDIAQQYGVDPVRFYITSILPEQADANFTWEDFHRFYNDIMIGTFGNFLNRVLTLAQDMTWTQKPVIDTSIQQGITELITARQHLSACEFKAYVARLLAAAAIGNKYIDTQKPWKLDRKSVEYQSVIGNALCLVVGIAIAVVPLIPETATKLQQMLGVSIAQWEEDLTSQIAGIVTQAHVEGVAPLFKKLELQ